MKLESPGANGVRMRVTKLELGAKLPPSEFQVPRGYLVRAGPQPPAPGTGAPLPPAK